MINPWYKTLKSGPFGLKCKTWIKKSKAKPAQGLFDHYLCRWLMVRGLLDDPESQKHLFVFMDPLKNS